MLAILLLANGPTSDRLAGAVQWHEVIAGQSLTSIGARFGVESLTLAADNGLRTDARLKPGQRLVVDYRHIVPAVAFDGASATVERTMLNSPGAKPIGAPGTGLGVGVGVGVGLGSGVAAVTGMLLAPVKNESAAEDCVVICGVSR